MPKTCSSFVSWLYLAALFIAAVAMWYAIFIAYSGGDVEMCLFALAGTTLAFLLLWLTGLFVDLYQ